MLDILPRTCILYHILTNITHKQYIYMWDLFNSSAIIWILSVQNAMALKV